MPRLTRYLLGSFGRETATIFGLAMVVLWLMQMLRQFDLVAVRSQDLLTLAGHALLLMPEVGLSILPVAVGVGMTRTYLRMEASRELHIVHTNGRVSTLIGAAVACAAAVALVMLVVSTWVQPAASRQIRLWNEQIAADLVTSAVVPGVFVEVAPSVVMHVEGRGEDGRLDTFFADDRRDPEVRRTYSASSAVLMRDELGYMLRLEDGRMQFAEADGGYAEIGFGRYDIVLDTLIATGEESQRGPAPNTIEIIAQAITSGSWTEQAVDRLIKRVAEPLKLLGLCLLVTALAAFPSGRRTPRRTPLEVVVVVLAVGEQLLWQYVRPDEYAQAATAAAFLVAGLALMAWRLRPDLALGVRRAA